MSVVLGNLTEEERISLFGESSALYDVLKALAAVAQQLRVELQRAPCRAYPSKTACKNTSNDLQHALDLLANELFQEKLTACGHVRVVASEENDIPSTVGDVKAPYVVALDPLDGSDNIDVNGSVGALFSIYPSSALSTCASEGLAWPTGCTQLAAGYTLYGSATTLVCTAGKGVHEFVFCASRADFVLANAHISIPKQGKSYAINDGHSCTFPLGVRKYIEKCRGDYTARYSGSVVADFHRHIKQGGIFLYPPTRVHRRGKLRLLFEANPLALLAQQAQGLASDGTCDVLSVPCTEVHQRTPLYIGSTSMVTTLLETLQMHPRFEGDSSSRS